MNHIAFARETRENPETDQPEKTYGIQGKVIRLTLDKFYEDISSTKIRENIDLNRDISNLIDAVAQNFIYDNNLYLREPAYKHVLEAREIGIGSFKPRAPKACGPFAVPSGTRATIRKPSTAMSKRITSGPCTSTMPVRNGR